MENFAVALHVYGGIMLVFVKDGPLFFEDFMKPLLEFSYAFFTQFLRQQKDQATLLDHQPLHRPILRKLEHWGLLALDIYAFVVLGFLIAAVAALGTIYCAIHPNRKIWE